MQLSLHVSVSELENTKDFSEGQNSVVMPYHHACFLHLSIIVLDPIDRVQPRSRTTRAGWLARFNGVAPSMQYKSFCRTTQHLESRSHQSNDWQTNRLTPRSGHILLHWVFLRLRIQIGDGFFPCLFLLDPFHTPFHPLKIARAILPRTL